MADLKVRVLTFTELYFRQFVYFMGNVSGKLNMNSGNAISLICISFAQVLCSDFW